MKKGKRKIQILAVIMSMSMMLLSACGSEGEVADEVAEVVADTEVVVDDVEVIENEEDFGEGEGKEEENEPEPEEIEAEEEIPIIPYFEENELEFCKDLVIATQGVRTNINDETDMELSDAEWTLKNISIEDEEDGKQTITIESECKGYYWSDRKGRDMFSIVLPLVRYCDLNTGECFPNMNKSGDMSLGYLVEVEWDNTTYEIDVAGDSKWDDKGDWAAGENGGYIHPTTVCYTDTLVVTEGYDSLGLMIGPFTIADMEDRTVGVQEEEILIKDVLESTENCYLFDVMDMYAMLNGDSDENTEVEENAVANVETDKSNVASANNGTSKENTANSGSKESTTPKQEQPAHTHSYASSVTKNPSCGENGVMTYTCACGSSYTEAIPTSGHQWVTTTETVSHPSTGHYEMVTRKELWCNCGFTCMSMDELNAHSSTHYTEIGIEPPRGVQEITENVWVVDSEGWTETINVTKCAVCGAQG